MGKFIKEDLSELEHSRGSNADLTTSAMMPSSGSNYMITFVVLFVLF